jgi:hypothetical protein
MRFIYLISLFLIGHSAIGQVSAFDFKVTKERRRLDQSLDLNKVQAQKVEAILTKSKTIALEVSAFSENGEVGAFLKDVSLYFDMHKSIDQILSQGQKVKHKNLIIPKDVFLENFIESPQGKLLSKEELSELLSAWKHL